MDAIYYLGGRFVFGSGSCCPQDFLFLTCFFSESGVPETLQSILISLSNTLESSAMYGGVRISTESFSGKSEE